MCVPKVKVRRTLIDLMVSEEDCPGEEKRNSMCIVSKRGTRRQRVEKERGQ